MTAEGFNRNSHEASEKIADGSEDNSKTKGKPESKKEKAADRGKDIWSKMLADRKAEGDLSGSEDDDEHEVSESSAEADQLSNAESAEDDPSLEILTGEEEAAVTRMYAEARLSELEAGRSESEDPADAAAREADIEFLQTMLAESEVVEIEAEENADEGPAEMQPPETPEARTFEPDEAVDLNAQTSQPARPTTATPSVTPAVPPRGFAGSTPSGGRAAAPAHEAASTAHTEYRSAERRDPKMGYLLLGGAIGYLIGRRRGRIKTEKRMATVQQKLEYQVGAVQQKIVRQEAAVQKLARENYQMKQESRAASPAASAAAETRAPQTVQRAAERQSERHVEAIRPISPKAESLSREQLLEASSHVRFGETNLRRVYEAQLVDETGLRRLMREAEAGHDLRRALAREFLVKELRFERDPRLKGGSPDAGGQTGGGTAITPQATADSNAPKASAPSQSPSLSLSAPPATPSRSGRQTDVSPAALIVLTILTLLLAIYAIWLTITR